MNYQSGSCPRALPVDKANKVSVFLWRSHDFVGLPEKESSGLNYDCDAEKRFADRQ